MQELYQKSQGLTVVEEISARNLGALTEVGVGGSNSGCRTDRCPHSAYILWGVGTEFQVQQG